MASQIAHIIYAEKYLQFLREGTLPDEALEKSPANLHEEEFFAGTIFPDIRMIDPTIKRRDTHLILGDLNLDFSYLDSFHAGWKLHLYCDMKREEILNKYKFYDLSGTSDLFCRPAKLLEDEIVYANFSGWEELKSNFLELSKIETGINVSRETLELWYAINATYIEKQPDSKSIGIFLSKLPKISEKRKEIVEMVDKLRKNDKVVELLKKVAEEII